MGCDVKADGNAEEQLLSTYESQAHFFTRYICISVTTVRNPHLSFGL